MAQALAMCKPDERATTQQLTTAKPQKFERAMDTPPITSSVADQSTPAIPVHDEF
jgi:hypothetical protein